MGNRAFIKFEGEDVGIYLHWNGGRDSVQPFLDYCKLKDYRFDDYGIARMCQVIGNFFGGGLSLGVQSVRGKSLDDLDPGANGVYIVRDWEIVGRYPRRNGMEQNQYDWLDFMVDIDCSQPNHERVGRERIEEMLAAKEMEVSENG